MDPTPFQVRHYVLPGQYIREYPAATANSQEDDLLLHINHYTPLKPVDPGALNITIIGAAANGLTKELFEPLWDDLYRHLQRLGIGIHGVWIADQVHQGESSILNENKLGNDPCWNDHSRDMLHIINHFREQMPRPLVGIGHSMGGQQLANLALIHPRLLSLLVLIDPVILRRTPDVNLLSQMSAARRDLWPSRAEAASAIRRSKSFQKWDSRVLDRWVKHSLRDLPTLIYPDSADKDSANVPVTLTTTKHQEVLTFMRPNFAGQDPSGVTIHNRKTHADLDPSIPDQYPFYRPETTNTVPRLPQIRPPVFYLFGESSEVSSEEWIREKLEMTGIGVGGSGGAKQGKVQGKILQNTTHFLPLEVPQECAKMAAEWLAPQLDLWRQDEEDFQAQWGRMSKVEKSTLSTKFKKELGQTPLLGKAKL